ncbi:hypothetical protein CARUB_v10018407mg [Capsella rubella]|uniref:apyrase n=1 Tax=Capsella rubella TaxID=81985 RepID=R0HIS2_9BRAS|nr:hypothetical protein CARUB_v10018407mg [Capsella rubella]
MNPEMDELKAPILPDHQPSSPPSKLKKRIIIPTVISGALALGIVSLLLNLNPAPVPAPPSGNLYSAIIDAGSSGSRVHVFKYSIDQFGVPVFNFGSLNYESFSIPDGLSTFANNLDGAKVKVQELVDFAKAKIPELMWSRSDIRLMATAGMRLIAYDDRENILNAAREVLHASGLSFRDEWASVISGLYAWVIANYALGSLGNDKSPTTGILELGGASAQVTFVSSDKLVSHVDSRNKTYGSVPYNIYSHSFPDSGKDAAIKRLMDKLQKSTVGDEKVKDPCTPKGYKYVNHQNKYLSVFLADESEYTKLEAAGDFTDCKTKTLELLKEQNDMCPSSYCAIGSTYTPKLKGNSFLATASFFFTSTFFKLDQKFWYSDLRHKGDAFCRKDWDELVKEYEGTDLEYLRGYCFSSAYIISMFERLGTPRVIFSNKVKNTPLNWALGAFIDTVSQPSISPAPSPAPTYGNGDNSRRFLGF